MAREFPRAVFLTYDAEKERFPHRSRCHTLTELIEVFEVYMQKNYHFKNGTKKYFFKAWQASTCEARVFEYPVHCEGIDHSGLTFWRFCKVSYEYLIPYTFLFGVYYLPSDPRRRVFHKNIKIE